MLKKEQQEKYCSPRLAAFQKDTEEGINTTLLDKNSENDTYIAIDYTYMNNND